MNDTKPMNPSEVVLAKTNSIPGEVFEAFNELIAAHWDGMESRVTQSEALKLVVKKFKSANVTSTVMFDNGWLDVEESYRSQGWIVEYDKPGYNESYEAFFIFRKR